MLRKNRYWSVSIVITTLFAMGVGVAQDVELTDESSLNESPDTALEAADTAPETTEAEPLDGNQSTTIAEGIKKQQNRLNLEQQFLQLQESLETEDAFSEKLGEDYLGYGMLLRESGQYKEAAKAFVDALHIAKVNNGIYSIEQRPALAALFETHFLLQNDAEYEEYMQRILWVERKNPGSANKESFERQLLLGNTYLNQFMSNPNKGEASINLLLSARRHLTAALRTHEKNPINDLFMPYGELALISFFEENILKANNQTQNSSMNAGFRKYDSRTPEPRVFNSYFTEPYPRGFADLNRYLQKARAENNQQHVVTALLNLGDYNQLFKKEKRSIGFYQQAWQEAQKLPEGNELRLSFAQPVALPNFNYAHKRDLVLPERDTVEVPLTLTVSQFGKVQKIADFAGSEELKPHFPRARRVARRKVFRPKMVEGELAVAESYEYAIRVFKK